MTVEKPIAKSLLRPITAGANSAMNQSEFFGIPGYLVKAREKSRVQGAIGFGSHRLQNWREFFKRSNRNRVTIFDSH